MEYTIIIQKNENGWYTGQCEQIPEAISQGETIEELKENMADAIKMVIDYKKEEIYSWHSGNYRQRDLQTVGNTTVSNQLNWIY